MDFIPEFPSDVDKTLESIFNIDPRKSRDLHLGHSVSFIHEPNNSCIPPSNWQHCESRKLRSLDEIPKNYRYIFEFAYFNKVQSQCLDEVFFSEVNFVLSAPTGSGKTVVFELAIVRELLSLNDLSSEAFMVYVSPLKALCSQKLLEWAKKFARLGIRCAAITGDTLDEDLEKVETSNIILTTPEKWDSVTRRWSYYPSLKKTINLLMLDEVHLLNERPRGATLEALVSRMKALSPNARFIAASATIPNIEDLANWLTTSRRATYKTLDASYRPVHLKQVVLGFPEAPNPYLFDTRLNYKLLDLIDQYSCGRPCLVFCSTRKGTQQAAQEVFNMLTLRRRTLHNSSTPKTYIETEMLKLSDKTLKEYIKAGIAFHNAGVSNRDRSIIENLFIKSYLPVIFSTSTLAIGVNLPAHLVIIKSTQYYERQKFVEYSETQILQMIGRAGRPQFDKTATAIILTTNTTKANYENLLSNAQPIESRLLENLSEHLNTEIVLGLICSLDSALLWLKSTFLYQRIQSSPQAYGLSSNLTSAEIDKQLLEGTCMKAINSLISSGLVNFEENSLSLIPTEPGRLMAKYCLCCETLSKLLKIGAECDLKNMIEVFCDCRELLDEISLRTKEKSILNALNNSKTLPLRFKIKGKIKTVSQKINCLLQATLGSVQISDYGLMQDSQRAMNVAQRISRCLHDIIYLQCSDPKTLVTASVLLQTFRAQMWFDSKYLARQLDKIGPSLATTFVSAGLHSLSAIENVDPQRVELLTGRKPPFGKNVLQQLALFPKFILSFEIVQDSKISVQLSLKNFNERLNMSLFPKKAQLL
ncbi:probable ATP-dependent DNA helicase HFM1 isoform X2 [Zophobas morio]|uniref:probable ATP-dependent DNA helicase HFM1 isoform X2 n=1 Tax=Zophobas morio TaxID=2755281 RepID=UPI003083D76A